MADPDDTENKAKPQDASKPEPAADEDAERQKRAKEKAAQDQNEDG